MYYLSLECISQFQLFWIFFFTFIFPLIKNVFILIVCNQIIYKYFTMENFKHIQSKQNGDMDLDTPSPSFSDDEPSAVLVPPIPLVTASLHCYRYLQLFLKWHLRTLKCTHFNCTVLTDLSICVITWHNIEYFGLFPPSEFLHSHHPHPCPSHHPFGFHLGFVLPVLELAVNGIT